MFFLNNIPGLNCGSFELVVGNMFGGKTTEFKARISKFKRQEDTRIKTAEREGKQIDKLPILVCKPKLDNRYDDTKIFTHDGLSIDAVPISDVDELIDLVNKHNYRVIAIDEIQFFNEKSNEEEFDYKIANAIYHFMQDNRYVIAAGLSKDFRGLPFGPMKELMPIACDIDVRNSRCAVCGADAPLPQRFVNGEPAHWNEQTVAVGASSENAKKESYEPRCRRCHEIKKIKDENISNAV